MKSIDALKLLPVWVEPAHLVSTARILMRGHGLKTLGVCEGGQLIGVVTAETLSGAPETALVRDCIEPPKLVLDSGLSIRKVAEMFLTEDIDSAPVVRDGEYQGIVTSTMLLRELNRSWDPLTNLSWQDLIREWGIENLKANKEVTVLFIDLDDFGLYNKRYGHTVGDDVLKTVAVKLQECIDPEREVLVRYGGDEFAIGTIRERREAEILCEMIRRRVADVFVKESSEPVTFCVGIFGGKRTKERENDHYSSTMDNLINNASKDCLAQKQRKDLAKPEAIGKAVVSSEASSHSSAPEGVRLVEVLADENSPNSMTTVILSMGESIVSGVSARLGGSALESVALATGKAVERAYPGTRFRLEDIQLADTREGKRVATVTAQVTDKNGSRPVSGVAAVDDDLYFSVAEATIEAFLS